MTSRIFYFSIFLALGIIGFGCKQATAPPSDPVVTHDPGEFGYSYNGTSVDRKNYPGPQSYGAIGCLVNNGSAGFSMDITLMLQPSVAPKERTVSLHIPMPLAMTGTFTTSSGGTSMSLKLDTAYYYA